SESLIIIESVSPASMVESGTITPPALIVPRKISSSSMAFVMSRLTLSPFLSPHEINPFATRFALLESPRHISRFSPQTTGSLFGCHWPCPVIASVRITGGASKVLTALHSLGVVVVANPTGRFGGSAPDGKERRQYFPADHECQEMAASNHQPDL